jgi:hypothetical protein
MGDEELFGYRPKPATTTMNTNVTDYLAKLAEEAAREGSATVDQLPMRIRRAPVNAVSGGCEVSRNVT